MNMNISKNEAFDIVRALEVRAGTLLAEARETNSNLAAEVLERQAMDAEVLAQRFKQGIAI